MNWQKIFNSTILNRGKTYFNNHAVEITNSSNSEVQSIVTGQHPYQVKIKFKDEAPSAMSCTCPHARQGNFCKHMAATLFEYYEAMPQTKPNKKSTASASKSASKILPTLKISEKDIHLYSTIQNYRNSLNYLLFAPEFRIRKIENYYLIESYFHSKEAFAQSIILDEKFRINNFTCTCSDFYHMNTNNANKSCHHINGVLLSINKLSIPLEDLPYHPELNYEGFPQILPIPANENISQRKKRMEQQRLISQAGFTQAIYHHVKTSSQRYPLFQIQPEFENQVEIHVFLQYERQQPYLTFKVVGDSAYKIKSIARFLTLVQGAEYYRYGQKLAFYHNLESFTPTAQKIIALLTHASKFTDIQGDSIYLADMDLDEFFDTFLENEDLLFDLYLDETFQNFEFEIIPLAKDYYQLSWNENFETILIKQKYAYSFDIEHNTLIRINCYDIPALDLLQDLIVFSDHEIIFEQKLYDEMSSLIQRANGEITPSDTQLIYKLDLEKRNIRIDIEGNTDSSIAEEVKNSLLTGGCTQKNNTFYYKGLNQDLLNQLTDNLSQYGEVWVSDELKAFHRIHKAPSDISVKQNGNLLSIDINDLDYDIKETIAILKSFRRKKEYHKLKNGETIKLDSESWQKFSDFLDNQGINPKNLAQKEIDLPVYHLLSLSNEPDINVQFSVDLQNKLQYFNHQGSQSFPLPEEIAPILKPYQKEGFQFLKLLEQLDFNGILADDMGLGKTLQALTLLSEKKDRTSLVICPASLIYNWQDEITKFFPDLPFACVLNDKKERIEIWNNYNNYQLIITSYDYLLRDIDHLISIPFYYVVLDESQRIKNMQTKSAKAAKKLQSEHRLALSGTPIENNLAELWSIFDFLMPGYLYSYSRFRKKFELPIIKGENSQISQHLSHMVKPFILRRLKKDVLKDLPEKVETIITVDLNEEERRIYQAHELSAKNEVASLLESNNNDASIQILALLSRLRLLCCDRSLVEDNIHSSGSKIKSCMNMVKDLHHKGQQILIFSSFTKVLDLLSAELKKTGISHEILQGSTNKEKRHEFVQAFQSGKFCVFLISLKAGGTGLNLTSAQAVIHFDPWWNKAAMNQATDRAYRIGQKQSVNVYSLLVANSIEERIFELQNKKWELSEQLIGGDNMAISKMNKDEFMKLFQ